MEKEATVIEHRGFVASVGDNTVEISLFPESGCAACSLKSACGVSEEKEKIIWVQTFESQNYEPGEEVEVFIRRALGFKALFLGYVLPFLIFFTCLLVGFAVTKKELFAGLLSLFILIPYYATLHLYKEKLKRTFNFSIKKMSQN